MTDLSREYGDGLYALCAEEGIAKEVLEQLQALKACFDEQPDFCRLLSNMSLSKQERVGIVDRTLRGQVHPYVLNFLKILCERGALHAFKELLLAFKALNLRKQPLSVTEPDNLLEIALSRLVPVGQYGDSVHSIPPFRSGLLRLSNSVYRKPRFLQGIWHERRDNGTNSRRSLPLF